MTRLRCAAIAALFGAMLIALPARAWNRKEQKPWVGDYDATIAVIAAKCT